MSDEHDDILNDDLRKKKELFDEDGELLPEDEDLHDDFLFLGSDVDDDRGF